MHSLQLCCSVSSDALLVDRASTVAGSGRFERLWQAAKDGRADTPADLRYLSSPKSKLAGESSTAKVIAYLQSIYDSVAENLPDVRDDGLDTAVFGDGTESTDPYLSVALPSSLGRKEKQPRRVKKGVSVHVERADMPGTEPRFLPPGTMFEYYEQFQVLEPAAGVSFKTFWTVWRTEFDFLKFRPTSSHAACSCCLHHKVLLKELSSYLQARRHQANLYRLHLVHQYRDRVVYWTIRGSSRLRSIGHLVIIQDGMDQCKFSFPRAGVVRAKNLSTLQRPKLAIIGILAHGFHLAFTVIEHTGACKELELHVRGARLHAHDFGEARSSLTRQCCSFDI